MILYKADIYHTFRHHHAFLMKKGTEVFCNGFGYILIDINQRQDKSLLLCVITVFVKKPAFRNHKRKRHMMTLADVFHDIDIHLGVMFLLIGEGIVKPYINFCLSHIIMTLELKDTQFT